MIRILPKIFEQNPPQQQNNVVEIPNIQSPLVRTPDGDIVMVRRNPLLTKDNKLIGPKEFLGKVIRKLKSFYKPSKKSQLKEIDKTYSELEKDLPRMQHIFKKSFLREDISLEQTSQMLARYKEVEKLGITGSRENYVKALFAMVSENFGFKADDFSLELFNKKQSISAGASGDLSSTVRINTAKPNVFEIMHHEFRHIKQQFIAVNYDPEKYLRALAEHSYTQNMSYKENPNPIYQHLYQETASYDSFESWFKDNKTKYERGQRIESLLLKKFNLKEFSKERVPKSLHEFAERCIDGERKYINAFTNYQEYANNFCEKDAFRFGKKIARLLTLRKI